MTRWFESLPIHRKLITMALAVSAAALMASAIGLVAFDTIRFRASAVEDAHALAQVIAENTAAAIVFNDPDAARQTLASVRVRLVVSRACVYRADGSLLAGYAQSPGVPCPEQKIADVGNWRTVMSRVTVQRNGRVVGDVFVERTLADLRGRVIVTALGGGFMLLVAGVIAFALAHRLQRVISRPIIELAETARVIGRGDRYEMPDIHAAPDETGELVRAFGDMVRQLLSSNEALRNEVDERRRMQAERESVLAREREASRLKDEFLAAVSHELRTPLNAILGWTRILASTSPNEQTIAKAIASLSRNAHAQNRVIEDLLDVSRIITGKLQLSLTAVDLRLVVESAIEVIGPVATAKSIHLESFMPAVACMVHADYDRLRQVIWNLFSNAVKFTPAGGAVSVRLSEGAGSYVIAVEDTGIGIAPNFVGHVFERFRQADGSTTREYGGLGLGLAIAKELTDLHGGTVRADSPGLGRGSIFTVTLPRLVGGASDADADAATSLAEPVPQLLQGIDVLAVDDNPDALEIVVSTLTDAGATTRLAASGAEALEQLRRAPSHIVLCDLAMPHMDGFEVLRGIRRLDAAGGGKTPVLAVSAYASAEYRARCLGAGFEGHLAKPYDPAELVRAISAAVGGEGDQSMRKSGSPRRPA